MMMKKRGKEWMIELIKRLLDVRKQNRLNLSLRLFFDDFGNSFNLDEGYDPFIQGLINIFLKSKFCFEMVDERVYLYPKFYIAREQFLKSELKLFYNLILEEHIKFVYNKNTQIKTIPIEFKNISKEIENIRIQRFRLFILAIQYYKKNCMEYSIRKLVKKISKNKNERNQHYYILKRNAHSLFNRTLTRLLNKIQFEKKIK